MIIHFSHDPEPVIAFPSLERFLVAMHAVGSGGVDIDDTEMEAICVSLGASIHDLALEGTEDANSLLTIYLPVSAEIDSGTRTLLARHGDFFVREAFATYLAKMPRAEDFGLAELLANDRHHQVAKQGIRTVAAIGEQRGGYS